jgi:hypothetical protein
MKTLERSADAVDASPDPMNMSPKTKDQINFKAPFPGPGRVPVNVRDESQPREISVQFLDQKVPLGSAVPNLPSKVVKDW